MNNDLVFSDVSASYYIEAREASCLFEDFPLLPAVHYKKLMKMLFKSCRTEMKLMLRLHIKAVKQNYTEEVRALRSGIFDEMPLPDDTDAALPAVVKAEQLSKRDG